MDPVVPSGALLRGSCGYGAFSRDNWPFWSVATASAYNFALLGKGSSGCGACLQVSCSGSVRHLNPEIFCLAHSYQPLRSCNTSSHHLSSTLELRRVKQCCSHNLLTLCTKHDDFHPYASIGAQPRCAERQADSAQPVVLVGDICTSCQPGDISIHVPYFNNSIGDPNRGPLPVQFRQASPSCSFSSLNICFSFFCFHSSQDGHTESALQIL